MDYAKESLEMHYDLRGKIEMTCRAAVDSKEALSLAYTPGVAEPCLEIQKDVKKSYALTRRWNTVAVVTDGTAVLGLGDIGPEAGMPVMEGKCVLFKAFGDVDAIPLCVRSKNVDEIVNTVRLLAGSFGGINLEDISSPRCVYIENKLKEILDIPVFHDDQHGTAIVVSAALINACQLTDRKLEDLKVVVSGTGAAGSSIIKMLNQLGVGDIIGYNIDGIVHRDKIDRYDFLTKELVEITNKENFIGDDTLASALVGADVFIGVSVANIVTPEMVRSMNKDPFIFAMANPNPEIMPEDALAGGALVVGTGRSDFPNQINNVLAFPGIFRGALDARATKINEEMKLAAAMAIASCVPEEELRADFIIPSPFDPKVAERVSDAVKKVAKETGVARI